MKYSEENKFIKERRRGPTFKLQRESWGPTFKFWRGSWVPTLNFRGVPGPTFKLWGRSRVPGLRVLVQLLSHTSPKSIPVLIFFNNDAACKCTLCIIWVLYHSWRSFPGFLNTFLFKFSYRNTRKWHQNDVDFEYFSFWLWASKYLLGRYKRFTQWLCTYSKNVMHQILSTSI